MSMALVLLPGMMCDERLFTPLRRAMQGGHQVIVPDTGGADTFEALAKSVLAAAPDSFALAGLSMGGILAMEVIRQAPDRVSHLALMDTNPFAEREEAKLRRDPQIKAARTGNLAAVMRDEMKPNYFTHIADNQHLKDTCMDMALSLGADVFINQSHALRARQDYSDVLRRVACPTLILCGRHDVLCPPERHHAMQDMMPHARLVIIDEAGHLPTLEVPEKVAAALDELLLMDAA